MGNEYIIKAILALGVNGFALEGHPTNEAEFLSMYRQMTGEDADNNGIMSSDQSDFSVTWSQVSEKVAEIEAAEPMRLLREERNRLLAETDWWVLPDRTATQAQRDYRQALRDITDTYTSLDTVVWPTKP